MNDSVRCYQCYYLKTDLHRLAALGRIGDPILNQPRNRRTSMSTQEEGKQKKPGEVKSDEVITKVPEKKKDEIADNDLEDVSGGYTRPPPMKGI